MCEMTLDEIVSGLDDALSSLQAAGDPARTDFVNDAYGAVKHARDALARIAHEKAMVALLRSENADAAPEEAASSPHGPEAPERACDDQSTNDAVDRRVEAAPTATRYRLAGFTSDGGGALAYSRATTPPSIGRGGEATDG